MKTLNNNWLTEGLIDFEYKKYILLAYFQEVKTNFQEKKLYPFLADLVFHYQNLLILKEKRDLLKESFPERMTMPDFEKLKVVYEKIVNDDEMMKEIEDILTFSIPEFKKHLSEGKNLYEFFESNMDISPIGISPLYPDEGYLFISEANKKETKIYEYQVTIFESPSQKYRGIHTNFIEAQRKGMANTYENMKIDLIRKYKKMPNPATYLIHSKIIAPLNESLLPIAKRMLVKYITSST